ncbi:DUF7470 family protein [Halovivax gelatinilyticus]|uniref:DUF7470 family protein n=1 Tax=Halovivax gelatinilyticus TaxID=2961597 RepID=UPI0020CA5BB8|nr:hypothetical protein [Halovivax gelatinilyticus]
MFKNLNATALVGILLLVAGVALIALENLVIAGGVAMLVVGLGMVAKGLISAAMQSFGML